VIIIARMGCGSAFVMGDHALELMSTISPRLSNNPGGSDISMPLIATMLFRHRELITVALHAQGPFPVSSWTLVIVSEVLWRMVNFVIGEVMTVEDGSANLFTSIRTSTTWGLECRSTFWHMCGLPVFRFRMSKVRFTGVFASPSTSIGSGLRIFVFLRFGSTFDSLRLRRLGLFLQPEPLGPTIRAITTLIGFLSLCGTRLLIREIRVCLLFTGVSSSQVLLLECLLNMGLGHMCLGGALARLLGGFGNLDGLRLDFIRRSSALKVILQCSEAKFIGV